MRILSLSIFQLSTFISPLGFAASLCEELSTFNSPLGLAASLCEELSTLNSPLGFAASLCEELSTSTMQDLGMTTAGISCRNECHIIPLSAPFVLFLKPFILKILSAHRKKLYLTPISLHRIITSELTKHN